MAKKARKKTALKAKRTKQATARKRRTVVAKKRTAARKSAAKRRTASAKRRTTAPVKRRAKKRQSLASVVSEKVNKAIDAMTEASSMTPSMLEKKYL